uniref:AAA+ ATPase domain-containing protein n=1 Tax=Tetradesmus obliquus TaxID=3088 RepID=A0A383VK48_TETOB|eukprot:jgi/Sobl393_1/17409/SZX65887.1
MSKTVDRESLYLALSAAGVALSACSLASVYLKPRRRYAEEVIGPDVEYVLSRAQAIQQENSSPVLTVDHLNSALEKVQGGGGGGGGGGDQLTKAELEATMKQMLMPPGGVMDGESVLDKFTNDLTAAARRGQLDPLVGRDGELRRLCHILLRRTKNNPVLVGEPGVGKTAIVEGLAQRIVAGDVPPGLLGASLLELDLAALAAGCMMPGEFEERLKAVCVEVAESSRKIILFIDDIHNLVPNAAQQGASMLDGSAILKPALARGTLRCLGCSSPDKFKKTIEKDPGLERRFQQVAVDPPNVEQATSILRGLRPRYERHHGITISEAALLAAAQLSARYISGRYLPDKAIDCLDEAAAQVKMEAGSAPEALDALNRKITTLQTELGQLASRAGEDSGDSSSGGSSFMASMARARGSAEKDATAAKCAQAVRLQLAELQEQQAVLAAEVAAEKEAEQELQDLRNNVLRLRFEVDYASRMDGRPDAPGEDAAASLAEKQEQLAEAQAAVQVCALRVPTYTARALYCVASHDLATAAHGNRQRCNTVAPDT